MSSAAARPRELRGVLADRLAGTLARELTLVLGFAVAIAAGSRIALPLGFTPVPVTAQTFVVLVGAAMLGARRASAGAATYLAFGAAGIPWFAVTGGATLGYLVGFVAAAALVGAAARRGLLERRASALGVLAVAHALVYVLGASVLALVLGLTPSRAIALGVVPFLLGDTIKVAVAALVVPMLRGTSEVTGVR
jgi:biotin transport system substrate-specific component